MSCRPGGPVRVAGDGEDEEDEQLRRRRRIHVRTRLHLPAAALSTSHAASCCDLHEPGLAHELMCRGDTHVIRWAPPRPMDHLLTTYHISTPTRPLSHETCGPHCPSPVPAFKSALGHLRFPKCRHDNKKPNSEQRQPQTQHHHLEPPPPPAPCPSNTSGTHGQRPGSSPGR